MKNDINIPIPKKEDMAASQVRREDYALKRDKQASEYNDSIAKRILSEKKTMLRCTSCGKEFSAKSTEITTCPDCSV